jgi:hypothetical protein
MKILFLILFIETATTSIHAQGTIRMGNSPLTPISVRLLDGNQRLVTAEDNLLIGAFYGLAGTGADLLLPAPGLATIGPVDGVMINTPGILPLPGTEPGQVVSLQVRVWDAALGADGWREAAQGCVGRYYGVTKVSQMTLGLTEGPSAVIWQGFGDSHPGRFYPLTIFACPEPSTLVLGALGGLGWIIFIRRRK